MKQVTLDVPEMKCGGCANAVRSALGTLEEVRRVDVSLDEGRVEVVGDDGLDPDELVAATEEAGYGATAS